MSCPSAEVCVLLFLNMLTPSSCGEHIIRESYKSLTTSKVKCSLKSMVVKERRKALVSISQRASGMDRDPHFAYDELCDLGHHFISLSR